MTSLVTTDKRSCQILSQLLVAHGIERAVLCPGSRNAPLIVALSRQPGIRCVSVIDERSAAFMALGMAVESGKPVAVVCTSGSAVLNFAPAVAEAYYRQVPLIVISADRPLEWIDQDDSQTIRQAGVLRNIVKGCFDVPVETGDSVQQWYMQRIVNDAINLAQASPNGPVHINVQLDAPLGRTAQEEMTARPINRITGSITLPPDEIYRLAQRLQTSQRVLLVAGFMPPASPSLKAAIEAISRLPNVMLLCEAQSNLGISVNIDSLLSCLTDEERKTLRPDLVITIGGSLVSRFIKKWLRESQTEHWHVGTQPYSVDCFMHLSTRIEMSASVFLPQLAKALQSNSKPAGNYREKWEIVEKRSKRLDSEYAARCPWSDYLAMKGVMELVPQDWHLQLSNGTAVRYAQLFDYHHIGRIDCNRGVSGIDGCTSTAIGAALESPHPVLLVTGDMSAQYDIGALAAACIPPTFKMIVLNNGGGGIFRFVDSTAALDELDKYFCCDVRLPLRQLASAYGFDYYEANNEMQLGLAWAQFAAPSRRPAMLNIVTDAHVSAQTLKDYFAYRAQL